MGSILDLVQACSDNSHSRVVELVGVRSIRDSINELVDIKKVNNLELETHTSNLTALQVACLRGDLNIVNTLLDSGARTDVKSDCGRYAIHYASISYKNRLEKVKRLVELDKNNISTTNAQSTPLREAARHGHDDVVEYLLDQGADINESETWNSTPLHLAAYRNHPSTVRALLKRRSCDVNKRNRYGHTPLHAAVQQANLEPVQLLVSHPLCDLSIKNNKYQKAVDLVNLNPESKGFKKYLDIIPFLSNPQQLNLQFKTLQTQLNNIDKDKLSSVGLHAKYFFYIEEHLLELSSEIRKHNMDKQNLIQNSTSSFGKEAVLNLYNKIYDVLRLQVQLLHEDVQTFQDEIKQFPTSNSENQKRRTQVEQIIGISKLWGRYCYTDVTECFSRSYKMESVFQIVQEELNIISKTSVIFEHAKELSHLKHCALELEMKVKSLEILKQNITDKTATVEQREQQIRELEEQIDSFRSTLQQLRRKCTDFCTKAQHLLLLDLVQACSDNSHYRVVALVNVQRIRDSINELVDIKKVNNLKLETLTSNLTALQVACLRGDLNIVNTLLDSGARTDVNSDCGRYAIHYASISCKNRLEKVKCLIELDKNINTTNAPSTPLYEAARHGHDDVVEYLLDQGADINESGTMNDTPLHLAAYRNHPSTVRALLKRRSCDVNKRNRYGHTPLHAAVQQANLEPVQLLVSHPLCDLSIKNNECQTAIEIAKWKAESNGSANYTDIIHFLSNLHQLELNLRTVQNEITSIYKAKLNFEQTENYSYLEKHLLKLGSEIKRYDIDKQNLIQKSTSIEKENISEQYKEIDCVFRLEIQQLYDDVQILQKEINENVVITSRNATNVKQSSLWGCYSFSDIIKCFSTSHLLESGVQIVQEDLNSISRTRITFEQTEELSNLKEYAIGLEMKVKKLDSGKQKITDKTATAEKREKKMKQLEEQINLFCSNIRQLRLKISDLRTKASKVSLINLAQACNNNNHSRVIELVNVLEIKARINELVDSNKLKHLKFKNCAAQITALQVACLNSDLNIVNMLLNIGARADIADSDGQCAVYFACLDEGNGLEKVKLLVEPDRNVINTTNALCDAVCTGRGDIVEYLLGKATAVYQLGSRNDFPFHEAVYWNCSSVISALLDIRSCDVNKRDNYGYTALHEAVYQANLESVKLLAKHPLCDLDIKNNEGQTALDIARMNESEGLGSYTGIIDFLRKLYRYH